MATNVQSKKCSDGLYDNKHSCCSLCLDDGIDTLARHYCVDCELYFCTKCVKCHNKMPASKTHQVNDVMTCDSTNTSDEAEEQAYVLHKSLRCHIHQDKIIETYCKDHDEVCCEICIAVKHRQCTTESVAVAAKDFKSNPEVNNCKKEFTKFIDKLQQEKLKRTENLDNIGDAKLELMAKVDTYEEQIIARIKSLAEESRKAILSKYMNHKTTLDDDIGGLDTVITHAAAHVEKLESIDDEVLFVNVKTSKTITNDVEVLLQDIGTDWKKKNIQFNFDKTFMNTIYEMKSFGSLGDDQQFEGDSNNKEYVATFQRNVNLSGYHESMIIDMCIMNSGDLLLADYSKCELKRYNNADLQLKDEISLQGCPVAVCKVNHDEVAVRMQSSRAVHFVSIGEKMQLKSSFTLRGDGFGMTCDASTGEILACEENKVSVYSKSGHKLRTYDKNINGEQMFSACRQIALSVGNEKLYVSDRGKGLIVLDKSGSTSSCINVDIESVWPLCVLPGNVCLVGGFNTCTFIQINKDGKQVGKIIDGKDGQTHTYCALYDRDHSRLIVGGYPQGISLYNISTK